MFQEKAPGFKKDRSFSADRKKKAGEREGTPHTNREEKKYRRSRSMDNSRGSSFDATDPEESPCHKRRSRHHRSKRVRERNPTTGGDAPSTNDTLTQMKL